MSLILSYVEYGSLAIIHIPKSVNNSCYWWRYINSPNLGYGERNNKIEFIEWAIYHNTGGHLVKHSTQTVLSPS